MPNGPNQFRPRLVAFFGDEALQRNVQRMQRAMPRAHGEEVPPRPGRLSRWEVARSRVEMLTPD